MTVCATGPLEITLFFAKSAIMVLDNLMKHFRYWSIDMMITSTGKKSLRVLCILFGCMLSFMQCDESGPNSAGNIQVTPGQLIGEWYTCRIGETIHSNGVLVDDYEDVSIDSAGYGFERDIVKYTADSVYSWNRESCQFGNALGYTIIGNTISYSNGFEREISITSDNRLTISRSYPDAEAVWWIFCTYGGNPPCIN
jgi:hypothetical protein